MAFNAATLTTTSEGQALVTEYAEALSSPAAEEVAFEAAGVGKISLEEGIDATSMALEVVAKNPELLVGEQSVAEVLCDVAKDVKKLSNEVVDGVANKATKFNKSQFLQELENLNANKIKHIIEGSKTSNHKWEKLVPDKNWNDIVEIIKDVMETGTDRPYGSALARVKTIEGEVVEVTYVVINGVMKISNAWIK